MPVLIAVLVLLVLAVVWGDRKSVV
jgi:hypothetical protein